MQQSSQLTEAAKKILESIAKSSAEEKKELLELIRDIVEKINIDVLNLRIVDEQGLEKALNKEDFIEFINKAFENVESQYIDPKIIELALQCVSSNSALIDDISKGNLNKLTDALKALSTNQKRAVDCGENNLSTSANTREKIILGAGIIIFSPVIALVVLVALLILGALFAKKVIKISGEKIKEGVVKARKVIKSTPQARENNFSKFERFFEEEIQNLSSVPGMSESSALIILNKQLEDIRKIRKIVEMVKNEVGQKAMEGLIKDKSKDKSKDESKGGNKDESKDGIIENFSIEDMKELVEKGESTDQADFEIFKERMSMLYGQVSPIIDIVQQKFHQRIEKINLKKIAKMNPDNQLSNPDASQTEGPKASQAKGPSLGNM